MDPLWTPGRPAGGRSLDIRASRRQLVIGYAAEVLLCLRVPMWDAAVAEFRCLTIKEIKGSERNANEKVPCLQASAEGAPGEEAMEEPEESTLTESTSEEEHSLRWRAGRAGGAPGTPGSPGRPGPQKA